MSRETAEQRQLRSEIAKMKKDLEDISMRDEYTAYVKLERKIMGAQTRFNQLNTGDLTQKLIIQYGVPYGLQFILTFILVVISFTYRYKPVLVFDEQKYNLTPFGSIVAFPTGASDAISVPFWIFMNSYVSRHIASYV